MSLYLKVTPELSTSLEVIVNEPSVTVITPAPLVELEVGVIALTYQFPIVAEVFTITGIVFAITFASVTVHVFPPEPQVCEPGVTSKNSGAYRWGDCAITIYG